MAAEDAELRDALGHVAVAFGDLEFPLSRFIWALLDENTPTYGIITADRGFRELVRLARLLYDQKVGAALQSFDGLERRLTKAVEDRDLYSHSWWNPRAATLLRMVKDWPSGEGKAYQLRLARRSGRPYERLVPFEEIHRVAARVEEVRNELEALLPLARAEAHPDQRPEGYEPG